MPEGRLLFWRTVSAIIYEAVSGHVQMERTVAILEQFLWGFLGSLAVEVVQIHFLLGSSRKLPLRYGKPGYWVARLLLALTAGSLAVAYDIKTPVLALHVGAATPLIVQALARQIGSFLGQSKGLLDEEELRKGKPSGRRNTRAGGRSSGSTGRRRSRSGD